MGNAAQLHSPLDAAKLGATTGGYGTNLAEEKGFGNGSGPGGSNNNGGALGMGGQGRLGLDSNGNALTVHKRQPKEETV